MNGRQGRARGAAPRITVALVSALAMAGFAVLFLLQERPEDLSTVDGLWGFVFGRLLFQAIGGAAAGWLLAGLFGRRGIQGLALALIGGVLVTLLAGLIGGVLVGIPGLLRQGFAAPVLIRMGMESLIVPMAGAGRPLVWAAWGGTVILTHLLAWLARR
ncbi:hypothetical protein [Tropicimonas sp. IMCC34043]|uniref:hypothetical protein n=1 Tax=Tropicimonas sp. IMCC34043 TaxID=2248760 RepID=UPI000E25E2F1|nr:hypothetical protein [Tropicimonas sp. IMCC34043]